MNGGAVTSHDHRSAQLQAISQLTFQQWFSGRAAFVREWQPAAADVGEQAIRADYIADKAWWFRRHQPADYPTFEAAAAAAATELPAPRGAQRAIGQGWLAQADAAITAAARNIPSRQWATTLIPIEIIEQAWGSAP